MKKIPERALAALCVSGALLLDACSDGDSAACTMACAPAVSWTELRVLAGQPGGRGWVDGPGESAHFLGPWGLAFDGTDHLYLTDDTLIREIDLSTNTLRTLAGGLVIGEADGTGEEASFFDPLGIAAAKGALYVCDNENSTLRKIEIDTGKVTTVAGKIKVFGHDDGVGTAATFSEPEGVVWDRSEGQLYISDTDNHTIRKMDLASLEITTIAGKPTVSGTADGVGAAARFSKPSALTLDEVDRALFISDAGNLAIRKLTLADMRVSTVASLEGASEALAMDGSDVLTTEGASIARVSAKTGALRTLAGHTTMTGFVDAIGEKARFGALAAMVADGQGGVFIADLAAHAVRRLDPKTGEVSTLMGASSAGAVDGKAGSARFSKPQGLAAVGELLYVADTENHAIRSIELASGKVRTVAGALGESGHEDGDGDAARFDRPAGLAFDGDNYLYIVELGNRDLRRLDLSSGAVSTLELSSASASEMFDSTGGLAWSSGHLYATDGSRILAVDIATKTLSVLAQSSSKNSVFASLVGIVADGHGKLFVADGLKNTVLQVDIASGDVSSFVGTTGFGAERLQAPSQVVLRSDGTLFVADMQTVREVTMDGDEMNTVVGTLDRQGVMPGRLPAQLGEPTALALTEDGMLAIASENSILLVK